MSRFLPHPAYAEDQPLHHTILTAHVLHRGFQAGGVVGLIGGAAQSFLPSQTTTAAGAAGASRVALLGPTLLRSAGVGSLLGLGLMAVGLPLQMRGREEIEWKDRSWRLLENEGQMAVDDWGVGGAVLGVVVATVRRTTTGLGVRGLVGSASIGNLMGVVGCMGWRYLVK